MGKMVPLNPREPDNLQFYDEAKSHMKNYDQLSTDWENLKQITLRLNEELAVLFEEIRIQAKKEIDLPYWCPQYSGDEPDDYLCPNIFIRSVYDEMFYRIDTGRKQFIGNGKVELSISGEKRIYSLRWWYSDLSKSLNEELMKKAQQLFGQFIEDEGFGKRIRAFVEKKKEAYDIQVEKVQQDIRTVIESIELGNTIKGKCKYCP